MADAALAPDRGRSLTVAHPAPRHSAVVRITHWITTACVLALLLTGAEIVISHPRFYWGETGNVNTPALFHLPIPASRSAVQTGYGYVLPDQNGWSRYLHFQSAWLSILIGLLYVAHGFLAGHFRRNLVPARGELSWPTVSSASASSYNSIQRLAYLAVVFALFPLLIWTGLAMSPAVAAAAPAIVSILGGQQSARTLHFFATIALIAFVMIHITMVILAGFKSRTLAMITGRPAGTEERT